MYARLDCSCLTSKSRVEKFAIARTRLIHGLAFASESFRYQRQRRSRRWKWRLGPASSTGVRGSCVNERRGPLNAGRVFARHRTQRTKSTKGTNGLAYSKA